MEEADDNTLIQDEISTDEEEYREKSNDPPPPEKGATQAEIEAYEREIKL